MKPEVLIFTEKALNLPSLLFFLIYKGFLLVSFNHFFPFFTNSVKWRREIRKKLHQKNAFFSDNLAQTAKLAICIEEQQDFHSF